VRTVRWSLREQARHCSLKWIEKLVWFCFVYRLWQAFFNVFRPMSRHRNLPVTRKGIVAMDHFFRHGLGRLNYHLSIKFLAMPCILEPSADR
jgi:hypothetical protein